MPSVSLLSWQRGFSTCLCSSRLCIMHCIAYNRSYNFAFSPERVSLGWDDPRWMLVGVYWHRSVRWSIHHGPDARAACYHPEPYWCHGQGGFGSGWLGQSRWGRGCTRYTSTALHSTAASCVWPGAGGVYVCWNHPAVSIFDCRKFCCVFPRHSSC